LVRGHRRSGLVDSTELDTVRRERLSAFGDQERSSAVSGDDAEAAERICDEPDKPARAASGVHALCSGGDVGFEVGERAELGGDDGAEGLCALGVERFAG
jgi:hypothetical protein